MKIQNRESGASLVLVIFMMVILVTFGILALTSASANAKLSSKTLSWRADYYALDARAADIVFDIDTLLYQAEEFARAEMRDGPDMESEFAALYIEKARDLVGAYTSDTAQVAILSEEEGAFLVEIHMESEEKSDIGQKYLTAQIVVSPPAYLFPTGSASDMRRAQGARRYSEVMWMQWQDEFDYYEDTLSLWNGLIEGEE